MIEEDLGDERNAAAHIPTESSMEINFLTNF
jgi:hypothetical protein